MPRHSVLVVEDEADVSEVLRFNLEREGYRVFCAMDGEKGLALARSERPDLVLLDVMLPGMDGIEVAKTLLEDPDTRDLPIIMVSAKGEESDIVLGLWIGADDYSVKPFRVKELIARVKAVLRRGSVEELSEAGPIVHGDLRIDSERHEVLVDGDEVQLTMMEFGILAMLASSPGRVFSREKLLECIQGDLYISERNIDVHITSVRRKLGPLKSLIVTVRGVGYKFLASAASPKSVG